MAACANNIRAIYAGGYSNHPDSGVISQSKTIEYFTMASEGDAIDFGDFISTGNGLAGVASPTRAVFGGAHPSPYNNYGFVEFATTGNAKDFGDLSGNVGLGGASNGHGGL